MKKTMSFMVNLRSETIQEFFLSSLKPQGYLVSPVYFSPAMRSRLSALVKSKRKAFLDNGNFSILNDLSPDYKAKAAKRVASIVKTEGKSSGKSSNASGQKAIAAATTLAWKIHERCQDLMPNDKDLIVRQMTADATHYIGCEDITMAAWLSLNLEPEYLDIALDEYRKLNAHVAARAVKIIKKLNPAVAKNYYPVASAVSYDTAFDAGRTFAKARIKKVAMGFGAYTSDSNYCNAISMQGKRYDIPYSVPARYPRMVLVARGFWEGYRTVARRSPEAFHFLGLGTPLFMALCAPVTKETPEITFDATSPIADAVEGTLYVSKPAYLKIQTDKVALRLATTENAEWDCPCPFCTAFVKKYPFNYAQGIKKWRKARKDTIGSKDLKPGGVLHDAYPLLSEPKSGQLRKDVSFARMGHNHWVIMEVTRKLTAEAQKGNLQDHVRKVVREYGANTKSETFANAARIAYDLATIKDVSGIKF